YEVWSAARAPVTGPTGLGEPVGLGELFLSGDVAQFTCTACATSTAATEHAPECRPADDDPRRGVSAVDVLRTRDGHLLARREIAERPGDRLRHDGGGRRDGGDRGTLRRRQDHVRAVDGLHRARRAGPGGAEGAGAGRSGARRRRRGGFRRRRRNPRATRAGRGAKDQGNDRRSQSVGRHVVEYRTALWDLAGNEQKAARGEPPVKPRKRAADRLSG